MRSRAALFLLIQFFVQYIPLAAAEELPDVLVEDPSTSISDGSGSLLRETVSGATVIDPPVASGAMVQTQSGAISVSSGQTLTETPILLTPPSAPVRIVITEVAWMGSNLSTADEWIEIAAFSSGSATLPRSVGGWTIVSVKSGVETIIARLPAEPLMSSGSVWVIANNHAESSRLLAEPTLVTTGMSLPNTQLLLRLRDGSGALVDEVDDGIGVPFAGLNPSGGAKAAMERVDPWKNGTAQSNWKSATLSIGFDDGTAIFGTPGVLGLVPAVVSTPEASSEPAPVLPPVVTSPEPSIRLTEILANPVGADTDEWIEIGSFDSFPIDLSELTLRTGTVRFQLSGQLIPGEHRRFGKIQTGLTLPNSSGTVELLWRDRVIDTWTYAETAEGISTGRLADGSVSPLCVPSPDRANVLAPLDPEIHVQSSSASAGKMSLNLEARVAAGSLASVSCAWSYPDGFASSSCNPPSHSMAGPLQGDVSLTLRDYCGNTMIRTLHVDIAGKASDEKDSQTVLCTPSAFTGVLLSEVFPNPVGDDTDGEWIELWNPTDVEKPLCGWSLDDGERGSDPYRLDHLRLPPGDRLLFERTKTDLALNNDHDAVRLFSPLPQGGSGAYEIVRFDRALEAHSFALRDDGVWLWNDDPTPSAPNAFEGPKWPQEVLMKVVQAMPNPGGSDSDGGEWVEIENQTRLPLPLTGWRFETASDSMLLEGVLEPLERRRIALSSESLTLANTKGHVALFDRDSTPVSMLAWEKSDDGRSILPSKPIYRESDLTFRSTSDCVVWEAIDGEDHAVIVELSWVGSSRVDLQACKLEYSIVSPK